MAGRFALLIGNEQYQDKQFGSLTVPGNDVKALKTTLENPAVGGFDRADILLNASLEKVMAAMGDLFANKNKDDLVLLYFSGHGALDRAGQLYLAVNQTQFKQLSSTAVWATVIKNEMNNSRSRRQVLILDCCHSGAFGRDSTGAKSAIVTEVINEATFDVKGYGREILVSSAATQLSWEGNKVIDKTDKSLFTHYLVEGLYSGKAAVEGKQDITVGQLYDYAYAKVVNAAANMTPQRWIDKQEGSIIIAKNPHPQIKPIQLSDKLLVALEDDQPFIREGAVQELGRLMKGKDSELSDAARQKLLAMQKTERDRYVWQLINQLLNVIEEKTPKQIDRDIVPTKTDAKMLTNNLADLSVNKPDNDHSKPKPARKARKKPIEKVAEPRVYKSKAGTVFRDTLKDGSKWPEMVFIPAGSLQMGSSDNEEEQPVHKVTIANPFAMGKCPVMFDEYDVFALATKRELPSDRGLIFPFGRGRRPVINVSWEDALAYVQ